MHKLQPRRNLDDLTLRPIISNFEIELMKQQTDLLTLLSKSENAFLNTADSTKKSEKGQYQMDTKWCCLTKKIL